MSEERLVELMSTDGVWRVGRKVKRTVYIGDVLVGLMDTPALAEKVVTAVNAAQPDPEPAREVNHGPLPDGGFWAGFCERCDTLGCPGDCDV